MCCGWSKLRLGRKCSFPQYNCYFRKQLPAFRLQDQDVSAVTKLQALVIKQHTTKELVNLLSNQYTDYQTNTPLLLICNYAIFHLITHNYKSAYFTLLNLMNHIHQLFTYKSITLPLYMTYHHSGNLSLWSPPSHSEFFRHHPEGDSWWIKFQISDASVGTCTPPFRRLPLPLFLIWFFLPYLSLFLFPGTIFLPLLCLPFSAQVPP